MRFGYACINLSVDTGFRSCIQRTLDEKGISYIRELMIWNFKTVIRIIEWNIERGIPLYRLSSDLVPFGSHVQLKDWKWWEDEVVQELGERARNLVRDNDQRITIHPGQFNNLSSPTVSVVESTFRDLIHQARLLELFGGTDMILHVGGVYEGKKTAIARFKNEFKNLPENVQSYLRIENDDKSYNIGEVLDICEDLQAKPCYDYHHDICLPSVGIEETKQGVKKLWAEDRIKVHLSTGRTGRRDRKHADHISEDTWRSFSRNFDGWDIDVMLEAKKKNLSVLVLQETIKMMGEV